MALFRPSAMQTDFRPISVTLDEVGHSFGHQAVFSGISITVEAGAECLVRGANGSGKSTLGGIFACELSPENGTLEWHMGNEIITPERVLNATSRVSPNTGLHPDLSIEELIQFQGQFREWRPELDPLDWLGSAGLSGQTLQKRFGTLSSGMQQRVKLTLALAADTGLVVLDEPCANLDEEGQVWYRQFRKSIASQTTVIVCSNDRAEDTLGPNQVIDL